MRELKRFVTERWDLVKNDFGALSFSVSNGNENPIGYTRTTARMKFSEKYQDYQDYKDLVYEEFMKITGKEPKDFFEKGRVYKVKAFCYYKSLRRPDNDNVAKGIVDSLFRSPLNDRNIISSNRFDFDISRPRVEVLITVEGLVKDMWERAKERHKKESRLQ